MGMLLVTPLMTLPQLLRSTSMMLLVRLTLLLSPMCTLSPLLLLCRLLPSSHCCRPNCRCPSHQLRWKLWLCCPSHCSRICCCPSCPYPDCCCPSCDWSRSPDRSCRCSAPCCCWPNCSWRLGPCSRCCHCPLKDF